MSFLTRAYFYEKTLNGSFDSQPHEYRMETDEFPTAEKLHDLIFQAIEIEDGKRLPFGNIGGRKQ